MRTNSILFPVVALVACFGIRALVEGSPELVARCFTTPSAAAASVLSGAPLARAEDGAWMLIVSESYAQKVTSACSGVGFFSLLAGVAVWRALQPSQSRLARALPALLAYPFALGANACRISVAGPVASASRAILDPKYSYIVHMALGALVFLIGLMAFNAIIDHARDYRKNTADAGG